MDSRPLHLPVRLRVVAVCAAALVLALSALTRAAALHASIHERDHLAVPHGEAGCAITLFAQGVTLPAGTDAIVTPERTWRMTAQRPAGELSLPSPRYLHQPERGPPFC